MPTIDYYSVSSKLIAEESQSIRRDYSLDALGSVVGTLASGGIENTYAYKPYGTLLVKGGAGVDPKFQWVGTRGYRDNGRIASSHYTRARHYDNTPARWTSVDPLWPVESPYSYCDGRPITLTDPTGRSISRFLCVGACVAAGGCALGLYVACKDWEDVYGISFGECALDYFASLPLQSQIGCIAGIAGCLYCFKRQKKCTDKRHKFWDRTIDAACDKRQSSCVHRTQGPRANLTCDQMKTYLIWNLSCAAAVLGRELDCPNPKKWKEGEKDRLDQPLKASATCLKRLWRECWFRK